LHTREDSVPGLLIKDFPLELHRRLRDEAARNHRSMTRQALALLEQALAAPARNAADLLPDPLKPLKPVTPGDVVTVIRKSRDSDKTRLSR
jgi:plasmid stability protein